MSEVRFLNPRALLRTRILCTVQHAASLIIYLRPLGHPNRANMQTIVNYTPTGESFLTRRVKVSKIPCFKGVPFSYPYPFESGNFPLSVYLKVFIQIFFNQSKLTSSMLTTNRETTNMAPSVKKSPKNLFSHISILLYAILVGGLLPY